MCPGSRPPAVPCVCIPPAGKIAGMPPTEPLPNSTSRISPSQNVGTDHRASETPLALRSSTLPGRQPARMPSHIPSQIEISVEVPISSMVGQSRSAIRDETRLVVLVGVAEVARQRVPDEGQEPLPQRLVEAELVPQVGHLRVGGRAAAGQRRHRVGRHQAEDDEPDHQQHEEADASRPRPCAPGRARSPTARAPPRGPRRSELPAGRRCVTGQLTRARSPYDAACRNTTAPITTTTTTARPIHLMALELCCCACSSRTPRPRPAWPSTSW